MNNNELFGKHIFFPFCLSSILGLSLKIMDDLLMMDISHDALDSKIHSDSKAKKGHMGSTVEVERLCLENEHDPESQEQKNLARPLCVI